MDRGLAIIGWDDLPDLTGVADREALRALLATTYPDQKPKTRTNWESQLWPFIRVMAEGELIVMPLKQRSGLALGRIVVQVKSQDTSVDVSVLRELQGVMSQFSASQGLLVAWGGVTKALNREAQRLFFAIRLWDSGDVIRVLQEGYEDLSDAVKADLPLKRIWTLAEDDIG